MADKLNLLEAVAHRRTYYGLAPESPISDERIKEIVRQALHDVPSAFNSQTTRLILVLKKEHEKLWDTISSVYEQKLPAEKFAHAKQRFEGFRKGYGTILFYEDTTVVEEMAKKFPIYADKFGQWSEHTSGMHQYVCWTALEAEGFGCNMQHYNPPINESLAQLCNLPSTWDLKSQMVFGKPTSGPAANPKEYKPIDGERLKVIGL